MPLPVWLPGCMFHLGGLCSGGLCPGGLCPGGLCPGGSLSSGSLSRGISVQGDLCKETPQTEIPSPSWWMSGQYVSYWNAVWFILSFYPQKKDKICLNNSRFIFNCKYVLNRRVSCCPEPTVYLCGTPLKGQTFTENGSAVYGESCEIWISLKYWCLTFINHVSCKCLPNILAWSFDVFQIETLEIKKFNSISDIKCCKQFKCII